MRIRRTFTALAVAALTLVATSAADAAAASGDDCAWALVAAPMKNIFDLGSVSALSEDDVRFTNTLNTSFPNLKPWVLRWDGDSVSEATQMTSLGDTHSWVSSSSFDSAGSGWMLLDGLNTFTGIGVRWHEGRWTMTPLAVSPDPTNTGVWPHKVVSLSPTDAWAVGDFHQEGKGVEPGRILTGALTEHWDGTRWRIVPNPADSRPGTVLVGLTAVSPTDVWAVGWQGDGEGKAIPLTLHWNGVRWSAVPAPVGNRPSGYRAVSGTGPDDLWAVGSQSMPDSNLAVPLVAHWDGTAWTEVTGLPDVGNARINTAYAASPTDVWATVEVPSGVNHFLHFDGRSWSTVPVPGPSAIGLRYFYTEIDGTGPDDIWAVGLVVHNPTIRVTPQIAHYSCGRR